MGKAGKIISIVFRTALAVGLIAYLIYSDAIDWGFVPGLVKAWQFTLLAVVVFIILHLIMALRLQILIHAHGLVLPYMASVKLTFIGLFFNTYLPGATGGDLIKIYYASKGNPGKRAEIITILIFDRIIGMFSLFTLPMLLAPFFMDTISSNLVLKGLLTITSGVSLGLIVCVIIGMKLDVEHGKLFVWIYTKLPKGELIKRVLLTIHSYRHDIPAVIKAVLLSVMVTGAALVGMLVLSEAATPDGFDARMAMLIPMGFIATAMPVTPGGIGVGEAALDSLFKLFDLHGGAELLLGWRLLMVLIGMLGLYYYLKGHERFVHHNEDDKANE